MLCGTLQWSSTLSLFYFSSISHKIVRPTMYSINEVQSQGRRKRLLPFDSPHSSSPTKPDAQNTQNAFLHTRWTVGINLPLGTCKAAFSSSVVLPLYQNENLCSSTFQQCGSNANLLCYNMTSLNQTLRSSLQNHCSRYTSFCHTCVKLQKTFKQTFMWNISALPPLMLHFYYINKVLIDTFIHVLRCQIGFSPWGINKGMSYHLTLIS